MGIYTYGTDGDYATPQDAVDACQFDNEIVAVPQPFTETNYIRGVNIGPFVVAGDIIQMAHSVSGRTLLPTKQYKLIFDAAAGVMPLLSGTITGAQSGTGSNPVSFVAIDGLNVDGINPHDTDPTMQYDWTVKNCMFKNISLRYVNGMVLDGNVIKDFASNTINTYDAYTEGLVVMRNNIIVSAGKGIYFEDVSDNANKSALVLIHNSFATYGDCITIEQITGAFGNIVALNNIFYSQTGNCITYDGEFDLQFPIGEGNIFYAPAGYLIEDVLNGIQLTTLAEIQERYGWNTTSINRDPQYNNPSGGVLTLDPDAYILSRGRAAAPSGILGNERATTIDPGAYQTTPPILKAILRDNHLIMPSFNVIVEPAP